MGNSLVNGDKFGKAFVNGIVQGGIGGISGGILGGLAGGIDAALDGRNFWHGGRAIDESYIPFANPGRQLNQFDCVIKTQEGYDNTYFGSNSRIGGYYDNLRSNNPLGVSDLEGYFQNEGYATARIGGTESVKQTIRSRGVVLLNKDVGITQAINGQTYRFGHAVTITGYKTFDNGRTLWQFFDPARGSVFSSYKLPTLIQSAKGSVFSVRPFYYYFPFRLF